MSMDSTLKKQSLKQNFAFQFIYQTLLLLIPLIISPFLTRVLGDKALGNYSYINSIAYYFIIFANLGISKHGQRIIAKNYDNEISIRKAFWSLLAVHLVVSLLVTLLYFSIVASIQVEYKTIYVIEGLYVASAVFDITWLFYGLENFKGVVIKNGIIKVVECVCIFAFLKKPDDLGIYALITSCSILIGQVVLIPAAIKKIKPIKITFRDAVCHIKPLLIFSISVIAVSLYTVFDKTLLGLMTTKENVAYYEFANRIISVPRTLIVIIGTVVFPRACKLAKSGDVDGQKKFFKASLFVVYFIGFASIFGLLSVSKQFSVIYYGESFAQSGFIMMATCALPLIVGLGDILRMQYLIPNGMDKEYIICIIINALINLALSCSLIPIIGVYGAVIGTTIAELFGLSFQMIVCKRFVSMKEILGPAIPFSIIGAFMFVLVRTSSYLLDDGLLSLIIQIGIGSLFFSAICFLYLYNFENNIWQILSKKMRKLKKESEGVKE